MKKVHDEIKKYLILGKFSLLQLMLIVGLSALVITIIHSM